MIGTIQKYEEHPILRFILSGSNSPQLCYGEFHFQKIEGYIKNMALSVSINTDDQGVFDTLLENEYALMVFD